jgi:hypothetical protein
LKLLVNNVKSKSISSPLHLGDQVPEFLDGLDLLSKKVRFQEVAELRVLASSSGFVERQERIIHILLQIQSCLDSSKSTGPLSCDRLRNVLKNDFAAPLVLVLDELVDVLGFFLRLVAEKMGKPVEGLVVTIKECSLNQRILESNQTNEPI